MNTPDSNPEVDHARCCIAGGGPAGVMLGFLLARAGVEVLVLEKHRDFFRDFRGDTIHPSTLELMHELGLLKEFLEQPHQEVRQIRAHFGDRVIQLADFSHLPVQCPYVALMPQWDFLNFLSSHARRHPGFRLRMEADSKPEQIDELDRRVIQLKIEREALKKETDAGASGEMHGPLESWEGRRIPDDPELFALVEEVYKQSKFRYLRYDKRK